MNHLLLWFLSAVLFTFLLNVLSNWFSEYVKTAWRSWRSTRLQSSSCDIENQSNLEALPLTEKPKFDVFISYARQQEAFAKMLFNELENVHYHPFFDVLSLAKGENFTSLILQVARQCDVAIVVLTEEFLKSKWTMTELCLFVELSSKFPDFKILPLFYGLSRGDLSESKNMDNCVNIWESFGKKESEKWRQALRTILEWNGLDFKESRSERDYMESIVSSIRHLLPSDQYSRQPSLINHMDLDFALSLYHNIDAMHASLEESCLA